jgi:hypothetical protein
MECEEDEMASRSASEERLVEDYEELLEDEQPLLYAPSHDEQLCNRFS